jgi:hypothetical protein
MAKRIRRGSSQPSRWCSRPRPQMKWVLLSIFLFSRKHNTSCEDVVSLKSTALYGG